jgi:hypothetical protein
MAVANMGRASRRKFRKYMGSSVFETVMSFKELKLKTWNMDAKKQFIDD